MTQAQLDNGADMLRLKLALAQLYLYQEHIYKACDVLWSLGDLTFSPGVVCFISVLSLSLFCLLLAEIRCSVKMFFLSLCTLCDVFISIPVYLAWYHSNFTLWCWFCVLCFVATHTHTQSFYGHYTDQPVSCIAANIPAFGGILPLFWRFSAIPIGNFKIPVSVPSCITLKCKHSWIRQLQTEITLHYSRARC